jgi:hypothetical protein
MTKQDFLEICKAVDSGATVCVEHDDGKQGKVLGCLQGGEAFTVEVKNTGAQEVWHRATVVKKVPC